MMEPRIRGVLLVVVGAVMLTAAGTARAESALVLPFPEAFGAIPASTYDTDHQRVGDAVVRIESVDASHVRLQIESGIEGGAHTIATADLVSVADGHTLRLLRQESRSIDGDGIPMGVLSIDHETGIASCTKGHGADAERQELVLPAEDRVANVPLNLLFQPLVDGSAEEISFQLLLCRFGARLIDVDARVATHDADASAPSIIEIESRPNLGRALSLIASKWIPKLSVWFDPHSQNGWIAHRVPLYSKGPEVFVIRDGFAGVSLSGLN